MIEADFKVGDVVRLKSGGHKMTVGGLDPHQRPAVICIWSTRKDNVNEKWLPIAGLELVKPK